MSGGDFTIFGTSPPVSSSTLWGSAFKKAIRRCFPRRFNTSHRSGGEVQRFSFFDHLLLGSHKYTTSGHIIHIDTFWQLSTSQEVRQYMRSLSGTEPSNSMYTVWIRPSTGRLCLDLMPPVSRYRYPAMFNTDYKTVFTSVLQPPGEAEIIASMSLSDYHDICDLMFSQWHNFFMSTDMTVRLCSVRRFAGSEYKDSLEIAFLPDCATDDDGWTTTRHFGGGWDRIDTDQEGTLMMRNGWIRINSANVVGEYQRRIYGELSDGQSWVGPANHIFNCLDITSNHADYYYISYFLRLSDLADNLPAGYLMLCPLDELQSELPGAFRIPDCPAYWSLDPSGVERLSAEEARNQGFPDIDVGLEVFALSWDTTVYAGTRQFHEAKGFDPYSQDVAIALGHPLFQLSCEKDVLFAHMQESDKDNYYSDSGTSGNEEFYECDDQESDMDSFSDEDSGNFVDAEEMHEPSSESAIDEDVP
ncbi:hypothetical protein B0H11DRAFT_635978 [Mycena galericulata]|nr:hypothetical protein B0H11DRAFT_635978 [Mycena galericulata]